MDERKYTICCDFDGVLHSYTKGWARHLPQEEAALVIADDPVPGALEWLEAMASDERFTVCVYSSRSKYVGAIDAMKNWLVHFDFPIGWLDRLEFPTQKPAASMTIDDRAFCFQGDFPSAEWLLRFKPWNK